MTSAIKIKLENIRFTLCNNVGSGYNRVIFEDDSAYAFTSDPWRWIDSEESKGHYPGAPNLSETDLEGLETFLKEHDERRRYPRRQGTFKIYAENGKLKEQEPKPEIDFKRDYSGDIPVHFSFIIIRNDAIRNKFEGCLMDFSYKYDTEFNDDISSISAMGTGYIDEYAYKLKTEIGLKQYKDYVIGDIVGTFMFGAEEDEEPPTECDTVDKVDWVKVIIDKNDGKTYAKFKSVSNKEKEANKKGKPEGLYLEYYESGSLKTETNFKNGKEEGLVKDYYENGELLYETNFKNGKEEGPAKEYRGNGVLATELNYKNGKWDGLYKGYYRSGALYSESNYKNGKLDGPAKWYYENGKLKNENTFKNGEKEGPCKEYYESGAVQIEATYKNGKLDGPYKDYDESGAVTTELNYYYKIPRWEGPFKDDESGALRYEDTYKNDRPAKGYYDNAEGYTEEK